MAVELCPLFSLEIQFQAKNGANNTNGFLKVFLAGTDDPAITYSDYVGTRNPQKIVLDDNGRAVVICDKSKAYRLEVYDANGMLLWTEEPVFCTGNGGGGVSSTRVISTDGSISVDESVAGSQRTYDIGIAPADSDEFLEWVKCVDEDVANGDIFPTYVDGTMETMGGQGLHVGKDRFYHGTVTIKVVPTGTGINYETLSANLKFGEDTVVRRNFDIDNSLHDSVVCEFSYDFKAPEDGYLYLNLENVGVFSQVDVEMQVHRIYSGINAVPDTCATKQWVQETFDYNLSGKIGYSALEYNPTGEISGISGSAIATTDPARVSAIASSYAESAVSSISAWSGYFSSISSKADQSAFEQCCDEVHSALEEVTNNISSISSTVSGLTGQYIEQSASGMFQPSGSYVSSTDMSAYVPFSGLEGDGSKITGISGSAIKGHEYTGISPVIVDNVEDTIAVDHRTLAVDETMTAYNSGSSAVIGVNVEGLNLSSKMDASASSLFYPSDNPSGFVDSSYVASAVSSKLDTTAFSTVSGNFLTAHQSLAGYATEQYVDSAVSSKLDASAYDSAQFYTTSNPSGFIGASSASAIASAYQVVSATATQLYAGTAYVTSVNDAPLSASRAGNAANASLANSAWYDGTGRLISSLPDSAAVSAIASSYVESGVSSKQDTLSFAYNTADQISSINGSALGGMDEDAVSGIASAYAESAVSGKADSSALSSYALSADVSGTVDLVSTQSANWGGSALALSAGPGVKLEKVGDTLVASQDRILLWSGDMTTGGTRLVNLSEPLTNFESLGFWHSFEGAGVSKPQWAVLSAGFAQTTGTSRVIGTIGPALSLKPWENNDIYQAFGNYVSPSSATNNDQIYLRGAKTLKNGDVQDFDALYHCYAIYGINRTAEA